MPDILKRFVEWIGLKEKLHNIISKPPLFKEGELWWAILGENMGSEINGKGSLFSRPVFIYKKLSNNSFMGLPTTSKHKIGSWYVEINLTDKKSTVLLSQARIFDYKRLSSKIGQLAGPEVDLIREKFKKLYCT